MIWNCLVVVFRIFLLKLKSSWFQNKLFWCVLSQGAIKYIQNLKTCPRTRIWSFYGCFKLLWNYSKWSQNDFNNYKIKKTTTASPMEEILRERKSSWYVVVGPKPMKGGKPSYKGTWLPKLPSTLLTKNYDNICFVFFTQRLLLQYL